MYGYSVNEGDDPLVDLVDTAVNQLDLSTTTGAFLVDVFPLLRYVPSWMPGAAFQKKASEWKRTLDETSNVPFNFVKQRMVSRVAV